MTDRQSVCLSICIYECMYIYIYVCVCVCVSIYLCTYIYIYMYVSICMCIYMYKVIAKCNCRDKVRCPLEDKCKQECLVYKVEVYSDPGNDRNKKVYFGSTQGDLRLGTITIKRVSPTRSIGLVPRYLVMCGRSRIKKGIDPILKWEVIKKCRKYRAGNRDCLLCMEEKLAIASCKSRDMLNQRS